MGRGGKGTRWWGEKQINMQLEKEEQKGEKKKDGRGKVRWKSYFLLKNCSFPLKFRNHEFWDHI